MANAFDQFDSPAAPANPFDQFDAPTAPQRSVAGDIGTEAGKGLVRGAEGFAGDIGEAVMGPFGPSHHFGNLMADLGLAERPKPEPTYGEQLAKATGVEASPQTTYGKFAGSIGEAAGNPASYIGPGGIPGKLLGAAATGAGAEAAKEIAPEGWEGPASMVGGLLGGHAMGTVSAATANTMRARGIPTTVELHQASTQAYNAAKTLGVEYTPSNLVMLRDQIRADLLKQGHRADVSGGTFRRIDELPDPPTPAFPGGNRDFSDIMGVRDSLNLIRNEVNQAGRKTPDAVAANVAINHIDKFIEDPTKALKGQQAIAQQAADFAKEGRGNWAAMSRSQAIEQALSKGELNAASSGSGGNIDNALRQQVKQILNNPRRAKNFTSDDRDIMRDIVAGNPVRNSARLIGKLAATGIVSAAGTEYLAQTMGLGPVGHFALPAIGYGVKKAADNMTRMRINRLLQGMRMDSPLGRANPVAARQSASPYALRSALTTPGNPFAP